MVEQGGPTSMRDETRLRDEICRIGASLQLSDTGSGTLLEVSLGAPPTAPSDTPIPLEESTHP
jgi:hypothetical protein